MDNIFYLCVRFLCWVSEITGLSYREVNVIYFCFINPAIIVWLFIRLRMYKYLYRKEQERWQ